MSKLTEEALKTALTSLSSWQIQDGKLVRDFAFKDFAAAVTFVNQVADVAAAANHHPDIDIRYNHVRLALISHDSDGITIRDIRFAGNIDHRFPT